MEIVYVALDLGSSSFGQVAMKVDGSVVNRSFTTSEAAVSRKQPSEINHDFGGLGDLCA